ncbi:transposase [Muricoccus aerilatus]|uniref:transposase n=1 Tax=Muricoccus aerilatus TaxID=452982 RepID=UPI001B80253E
MPFKANAERRHRIPKQQLRATNWAEYDAALRGRGSLTVWFTDAATAASKAEPRTTRGGQRRYSALAISTAPTLRTVFRLTLRQTEGLIGSIIALLGFDLPVPGHTTLSRRAETFGGAGALVGHPTHTSDPRQHEPAAMWPRRVAGPEAREQDAPAVAQAAHRRGCQHGADRRAHPDDERRRCCLAVQASVRANHELNRLIHRRWRLRPGRRLL